jgi:hypothetical protein
VEVALDGADGDAHVVGDDGERPVELMEKDDGLTLLDAQELHGLAEARAFGVVWSLRAEARDDRGAGGDGVEGGFAGCRGMASGELVEKEPASDGEKPGGEAVLAVEAIEVSEGAEEGFLGDVFGQRGASAHAEQVSLERPLMGPDQLARGGAISGAGAPDQLELLGMTDRNGHLPQCTAGVGAGCGRTADFALE